MTSVLFLQSSVQDPYAQYENMLRENRVYWDDINKLWSIYSYEDCKAILQNSLAVIPPVNSQEGLNEYALSIMGKLARLTNGIQHEIAKHVVILLFGKMKSVSIMDIIENIIKKERNKYEIDWVNSISKKLPAMVILKSFDFKQKDSDFILDKIHRLVKIMSPARTREEIAAVNEISWEIYTVAEKHISGAKFYKSVAQIIGEKYKINPEEAISYCISNLIGLIIQSYDAGRGILSNSLLQVLRNEHLIPESFTQTTYFEKSVIETLRYDPPVQNTRRIADADILMGDTQIKAGQQILLMLAAANRDPDKFHHPHVYDVERSNNMEHLTFGTGGHACPANHLSVALGADALSYICEKYKRVRLVEQSIEYEPAVNVRLPKNIFISLL